MIACPGCGQAMPAGYGKRCESCYWKSLLAKRIDIASAAFAQPEHAEQLRQFGAWLERQIGEQKAAITLNRYLPFFLELSALEASGELLAHFPLQVLKKNRLPLHFLEETGGVTISKEARQEAAEQERIRTLLASPVDDYAKDILVRYHAALMVRWEQGKLSFRSIRLALRPAVSFLEHAKERPLPSQADLISYLCKSPGQRSALTGFVCFLREGCKASLELPKRGTKPAPPRKEVEAELIRLLRTNLRDENHRQLLIGAALSYFHRIPRQLAAKMATSGKLIKTPNEAWAVLYEGRHYWLPHDLVVDLL